MQQHSRLAVLGAVFGALLLVGAGCSFSVGDGATESPSLGDKVLVQAENSNPWYQAEVESFSDNVYTVRYSDGDSVEEGVTLDRMAPVPSGAAMVKVGDRVVAAWMLDSFYAGTVTAVGSGAATIRWDDGSEPKETALDQMVKPFK